MNAKIPFYAVRDTDAQAFNIPFAAPNDEAAKLAVRQQLAIEKDPYLNKFIDALYLVKVGAYDMSRGCFCFDPADGEFYISLLDIAGELGEEDTL